MIVNKVLLPNFQHRILVGMSSFVGTLLLVGWVIINEPARMDVFTQQWKGRSIEQGAQTFLNNCSTCHGDDAEGIEERGPALKNPMLFLTENPAKVQKAKIDELAQQKFAAEEDFKVLDENKKALTDAQAKLKTVQAGSDDEKKLQADIASLTTKINSFDVSQNKSRLDKLTTDLKTAQDELERLKVRGWDETRDTRRKEVKWAGTLEGYLESTITSGRPVSALYWSEPMPAWGQQAGGPMRPDEIKNVVAYIVNYQEAALKLTPADLKQQFKVPGAVSSVKVNESGQPIGKTANVKQLIADGKLKDGDATLGEAKYSGLACAGCHNGTTAPSVDGTFTRITNERLKDAKNTGKTAEEYIAESIVRPSDYLVPNFVDGVMPQDFGTKLDAKDIADIIAFLQTKK